MLGHVSFRAKFGWEQVEATEREADAFAVQLLANDLAFRYGKAKGYRAGMKAAQMERDKAHGEKLAEVTR